MAKARTSVKERAIKAWFTACKIDKDDPHLYLTVYKSRSKKLITVRDNYFPVSALTWSYKGGTLRRVEA